MTCKITSAPLAFMFVGLFFVDSAIAQLAETKTKQATVVAIDLDKGTVRLKYKDLATITEELFTCRDPEVLAVLSKLEVGSKVSVTYEPISFKVSRLFAYGRKENETAPPTGDREKSKAAPTTAQGSPDLERLIADCRTAEEVVFRYEMAMKATNFDAAAKQLVAAELPKWQELAKDRRVRFGKKWMPLSEAKNLQKQADLLIDNAVELIKLQNGKLAAKKLDEANSVDPESVRANFIYGFISSVVDRNDAVAISRFRDCLRREPESVSVLNNLALCEMKSKKFREAIEHWKKAGDFDPSDQLVAHNLGRFVSEARAGAFGRVDPTLVDKASLAYLNLRNKGQTDQTDQNKSWLFHLPPDARNYREAPADAKAQSHEAAVNAGAIGDYTVVGWASGFVIAPGVILTNRHVVADEEMGGMKDGLRIVDPDDSNKTHDAAVIAVSLAPGPDLALIRSPSLTKEPLPIARNEQPRLAAEIMVLGYPRPEDLGVQLKATTGRVMGLPAPPINALMYDAATDGGNSGGPVVDDTGTVIAVHFRAVHQHKNTCNGGVPCGDVWTFVKRHIPVNEIPESDGVKRTWPDVVDVCGPSTVRINILGKIDALAARGTNAMIGATKVWEDPYCVRCGARGTVDCPTKGCARGAIAVTRTVTGRDPISGARIQSQVLDQARCNNCGGDGFVTCPSCNGQGKR